LPLARFPMNESIYSYLGQEVSCSISNGNTKILDYATNKLSKKPGKMNVSRKALRIIVSASRVRVSLRSYKHGLGLDDVVVFARERFPQLATLDLHFVGNFVPQGLRFFAVIERWSCRPQVVG